MERNKFIVVIILIKDVFTVLLGDLCLGSIVSLSVNRLLHR